MAVRYWHWLLIQKKGEPVSNYYIVDGTGELNQNTVFDKSDYEDYEYDGIIINTEQNDENT